MVDNLTAAQICALEWLIVGAFFIRTGAFRGKGVWGVSKAGILVAFLWIVGALVFILALAIFSL